MKNTIRCILTTLGLVLVATTVHAETKEPYIILKNTNSPHRGAGTVEEFFSYGCIHCKNFDPIFLHWESLQGKNITVEQIPVFYKNYSKNSALLYYTLREMGLERQMRADIFTATIKNPALFSTQEGTKNFVVQWFKTHKRALDENTFVKIYKSFAIKRRLQIAAQKIEAYNITHFPVLVVNGSYKTDLAMAGGSTQLLQLLDKLIAKRQKNVKTP